MPGWVTTRFSPITVPSAPTHACGAGDGGRVEAVTLREAHERPAGVLLLRHLEVLPDDHVRTVQRDGTSVCQGQAAQTEDQRHDQCAPSHVTLLDAHPSTRIGALLDPQGRARLTTPKKKTSKPSLQGAYRGPAASDAPRVARRAGARAQAAWRADWAHRSYRSPVAIPCCGRSNGMRWSCMGSPRVRADAAARARTVGLVFLVLLGTGVLLPVPGTAQENF